MHNRVIGVLSFLSLISATTSVASAAPQQVSFPGGIQRLVILTGHVSGMLSGTRTSIAGASIELLNPKATSAIRRVIATTVSDEKGDYRFTNPAPDADGSAPATYDVPPGQYQVDARYRSNNVLFGIISLRPDATNNKNLDMGKLVLKGGAAPPKPSITFWATDRETFPNGTNVQNMFMNKRINVPCGPTPTCVMHYGRVRPVGPLVTINDDVAPDFVSFSGMLGSSFPGAQSVLIYVHGYNQEFYEQLLLTATWVAAYNSNAPVILYSWPSNDKPLKYLDDETNNMWAYAHFRDFLIALLNAPNGPRTVNIIGHSMGNRLVVGALDYIASAKLATTNQIGQVIFAAPDIDAGMFYEDLPRMASVVQGLTVYGSTHDEALQLSRQVHGHCRAGLVGCDYAVPAIANVNAIDASIFQCDFLGHGYWNASTTMRSDIAGVLSGGVNTPASIRPNLERAGMNTYAFNRIASDDATCSGQAKGS
jgi:esterase/lipase superfamily enzyme